MAIHNAFNIVRSPILLVAITILYALVLKIHLSADGIEHLRLSMANGTVHIVNPAREYSYWMLQWPIFFLHELNIRTLGVYIIGYATGIFICLFSPLIILFYLYKNDNAFMGYLFIYTIALSGVSFSSIYILGTDHQAVLPLVFSIAIILKKIKETNFLCDLILLFLLIILGKVYEAALLPLVFIWVYFVYLLFDIQRKSYIKMSVFILGFSISAFGVYLNIYSILHPISDVHRGIFLAQALLIFSNPVFITFSIICISLICTHLRFNKFSYFLLFLVFLFQIYCFFNDDLYGNIAFISFASRVVIVFIPATLIAVIFLRRPIGFCQAHSWVAVLILCSSCFISMRPFDNYLTQLSLSLEGHHSSYINIDDTHLASNPAAWGWTFPSMSIVVQPNCVLTIALNSRSVGWEPYNPMLIPGFGAFVRYEGGLYTGNQLLERCSK
jgi:hypothetical protein